MKKLARVYHFLGVEKIPLWQASVSGERERNRAGIFYFRVDRVGFGEGKVGNLVETMN